MVKNLPAMWATLVRSLRWIRDPLEEGLAPHSSVLAWEIRWTEEPGGLRITESDTTEQLRHTHIFCCSRVGFEFCNIHSWALILKKFPFMIFFYLFYSTISTLQKTQAVLGRVVCSWVLSLLPGSVMRPPSTVSWSRSWPMRWTPAPTPWTKPTHASQRWGANGKCPFCTFFWCYVQSLILATFFERTQYSLYESLPKAYPSLMTKVFLIFFSCHHFPLLFLSSLHLFPISLWLT